MGRFYKNHAFEIGLAVFAVGLILAILSYLYRFAGQPGWLGWWGSGLGAIPGASPGQWNLVVMIVATILVVMGGWTAGEQFVLRRRFERLIDTPKKSEFTSNRRSLDNLTRRLPDEYKARLKAKENEFRSVKSGSAR